MATPDDAEAIRRFRQAVFDGDDVGIGDSLADDVIWGIGGSGRFAGLHEGPDAVVKVFTTMWDLSRGTFRPFSQDSHDILLGEAHVSLLDRYVASRGKRQLDSFEAWVMHVEDGLLKECFHYLHDQRAFDVFWW